MVSKWDTDNDGIISRAEFRKEVKLLVPNAIGVALAAVQTVLANPAKQLAAVPSSLSPTNCS